MASVEKIILYMAFCPLVDGEIPNPVDDGKDRMCYFTPSQRQHIVHKMATTLLDVSCRSANVHYERQLARSEEIRLEYNYIAPVEDYRLNDAQKELFLIMAKVELTAHFTTFVHKLSLPLSFHDAPSTVFQPIATRLGRRIREIAAPFTIPCH